MSDSELKTLLLKERLDQLEKEMRDKLLSLNSPDISKERFEKCEKSIENLDRKLKQLELDKDKVCMKKNK